MLDAAKQKAAHERAMRMSVPDISASLQELLGQKQVAQLAGAEYSKTVGRWINGDSKPRGEAEDRLRFAYQVTQLLAERESAETVRAWFAGLNPSLSDKSPADAIRAGKQQAVLNAVKEFLGG